ncbi:hypothetical protein [Actinomadura parmotrematis]|uniref:Uncharacterized protein n=1 Tax=Actinomadura parmotrematis TaxID=2864039 RepID=A0ABS7FU67_9ACTN|nr:hypothetical protein [Actinomadura parmotrematis]MBW8483495.1 hypothetical protein [Actinomadura parmotrematis]
MEPLIPYLDHEPDRPPLPVDERWARLFHDWADGRIRFTPEGERRH